MHFLVQIYCNKLLQLNKTINEMSNEELKELSEQKTKLRIQLPGVCAYFFELMLEIIFKDILNWDM
jgi:hypothetical protein